MCDGVALDGIAAAEGTPLYVYSAATIAARYRAIDAAFAGYPHAIHYALKANSTLAITRLLRGLGSSADANSGGEIDVALRAGFIPAQIVFTGVGKTMAELGQAIDLGVRTINVESAGEIERVDALSRERGLRTKIAIRINPDVDAKTHPHISTGLKINKFGIALADVPALCAHARGLAGVEVIGLHAHIGSQITDLEPLRRAAARAGRAGARAGGRGHTDRAPRSRRRAGRLVRRLARTDRAGIRRRRPADRPRIRPGDRPRTGAAGGRARRRAADPGRRRRASRPAEPTNACSSSWTPA